MKRAAKSLGHSAPAIGSHVSDRLVAYDSPGNVRELENVLERAVILCERCDRAGAPALERRYARASTRAKEIGRKAIEDALALNAVNRTKAAEQLGISVRTLQYRLKEACRAESK